MLEPRLEPEGDIERHNLGPTGSTAISPSAQVDLASQGDQPPRRPTVRLERSAAQAIGRDREGRLEQSHEFGPEPLSGLGQGGIDRPLERAEIGVLGTQGDGQRDGMLHVSPFSAGDLNISSLWTGLLVCRLVQHRRLDAYSSLGMGCAIERRPVDCRDRPGLAGRQRHAESSIVGLFNGRDRRPVAVVVTTDGRHVQMPISNLDFSDNSLLSLVRSLVVGLESLLGLITGSRRENGGTRRNERR